jgi:hypothetical protein
MIDEKDDGTITGMYATVYFGSWVLSGLVELDEEDRIIISSEETKSKTMVFKTAICAITLLSESEINAKKEKESNVDKPLFSAIRGGKKESQPQDEAGETNSGMYIPLTVLRQDPEKVNPLHQDDFSTFFTGKSAIDFTAKE